MKPHITICATTTRYWSRQIQLYIYATEQRHKNCATHMAPKKMFLPTDATHLCNKISKTVQLKKDGVPI